MLQATHPHYRTNSLEADPPGSGPGASASYMREKTVIAEETGHHRQRECDGEGGGGNAFTSSEQGEVQRREAPTGPEARDLSTAPTTA